MQRQNNPNKFWLKTIHFFLTVKSFQTFLRFDEETTQIKFYETSQSNHMPANDRGNACGMHGAINRLELGQVGVERSGLSWFARRGGGGNDDAYSAATWAPVDSGDKNRTFRRSFDRPPSNTATMSTLAISPRLFPRWPTRLLHKTQQHVV